MINEVLDILKNSGLEVSSAEEVKFLVKEEELLQQAEEYKILPIDLLTTAILSSLQDLRSKQLDEMKNGK